MKELIEGDKKKFLLRIIAISIAAVIFVPVLYSGIYLYAFWDPYGNFNNVPVAFVNLDKAVVKDGKVYNIGKDIENNLKNNKKVGWKFVSYDVAKKGVTGEAYYAAIIVPEDFSKKISDAASGNLVKPSVIYEANAGKNFVFAQVSERAAESIKSEIASSIQEGATKALASTLYDVKASLFDASNGANKLQDGTSKLADGSKQISTGLSTAASGSKQLQDGLKQAAAGESQLSTGIDSLINGLNQFKSGLSQNSGDIPKLVSGAKSLSDGMSSVTSAANSANLPQGLTTAADTISQIKTAIIQANSILTSSTDQGSIDQVKGILTQLTNTINSQDVENKLRASAASAGTLTTSLDQLSSGAQQVAVGTNTMAATLASSQSSAAAGIDQLNAGAKKLKSGSIDILNGLNTAVTKTGDLATGLNDLNTGASALNSGLITANDGAIKLKNGLKSGYDTMNTGLKFSVEDLSKFVTNPLTLSDVSINKVTYYGEGLAPYFVSLSLWLGAMLINLILSLSKLSKIIEYKYYKTYTGTFLVGCVLVAFQSIILSIVLINGLGLKATSQTAFYLSNILVSIVFFTIMYGISYAVGVVGTPFVFILFILQLASSGGTFPIETAPRFFRALSPFFPMTYTVEGLRMIISGINAARFAKIIIILLLFMAIFYIGGYVVNRTFKGLKNLKVEAE